MQVFDDGSLQPAGKSRSAGASFSRSITLSKTSVFHRLRITGDRGSAELDLAATPKLTVLTNDNAPRLSVRPSNLSVTLKPERLRRLMQVFDDGSLQPAGKSRSAGASFSRSITLSKTSVFNRLRITGERGSAELDLAATPKLTVLTNDNAPPRT